MTLRSTYRFLTQDLAKLSLLRDRHAFCHMVTMQQSGTHWVDRMLSQLICRHYGIDTPETFADRKIIGDHKNPAVHAAIPRIIRTHNIPSPVVHATPLRQLLKFPKYIVLVRDLRAGLVSHYEKKHANEMTFSAYLRSDRVLFNRVRWDLWTRFRFLNAWHRDIQRLPESETLVVRYEDTRQSPEAQLKRIWTFMELPALDDADFAAAAETSTKQRMAQMEYPDRQFRIVRQSRRDPLEWFSESDRQWLTKTCQRHLKSTFGYDYANWSPIENQPSAARGAA